MEKSFSMEANQISVEMGKVVYPARTRRFNVLSSRTITVLTFFEMLKMSITPNLKDYWNFLPVGSFVKKPVSKKKKNFEAHYQQIWEIL